MQSVTSQINRIRRVLRPISLLSHDVIVEKIDIEIPDMYDCATRVLRGQMYESAWNKLIKGLDITNEKRNTVVTFTSELGLNTFNCMIANVKTRQERTLKTQVLYTDDDDEFDLKNIKPVRNEKEFNAIDKGETNYINKNKTYVIKTLTRELYSGYPEEITDIVVYIPAKDLYEI